MKRRATSTALVAFALVVTGCEEKKTYAPAPLEGGEAITYTISSGSFSNSYAKVSFERTATGFFINCDQPTCKPQKVGLDLQDGRNHIKALDLGLIWLPPSLRAVGSQHYLGKVVRHEQFERRQVVTLSERNGQVMRRYDLNTGFLVHLQRNGASTGMTQMARLHTSTIRGL